MPSAPETLLKERTIDVLTLRTGFEIELLAPPGSDRRVLADALAARTRGSVRRSFHTDSEPSTVPGVGVFRHLSPAFDVVGDGGRPVARLVDDVTIESGLTAAPRAPVADGWFRVLCDDARLLRLIERHVDPDVTLPEALRPVAELFGSEVELLRGAARVNDPTGATIAVAMALPGGRERPCEVITPPLATDHGAALDELLTPARDLGFTVPVEAAVHLHVDGAPFRRTSAFANLVRLFALWRDPLWAALKTNHFCKRLAPLPADLLELVDSDPSRPWEDLAGQARALKLTKYSDINLTQLVALRPVRDTVEVRILPGDDDAAAIVDRAALVERLLLRCLDDRPVPAPGPAELEYPAAALEALALEAA
ncbi:hypothetical protein GCM10028784_29460 [Myceligenerans cantabricum]